MQPIKQLSHMLVELVQGDRALFTLADLRATLPNHDPGAFPTLISRAAKGGLLQRVCRGLYLYPHAGISEP